MRSKIRLHKPPHSPDERKKLFDKFNNYWNDYINKEIKRKFSYVISNKKEEVQKKIKDFRSRWGIPENGFKFEKEIINWFKRSVNKQKKESKGLSWIEEITPYKSSGFILDEEKTKTKVISPKNREGKKWLFVSHFQKQLQELAAEIGLDNAWYLVFEYYVLTNKLDMKSITDTGIKIFKKIKKYTTDRPVEGKIILEFGPNTRLEDIKKIWTDQVKLLQKKLPGYIEIPPHYKQVKKEP